MSNSPRTRTSRRPFAVAAGAAALLAAAACRDVTVPLEDPANTTYAPRLGVNLANFTRTASGVYYQDVVQGSGAVVTDSSTVSVLYYGALTNGRIFDSTATNGQARNFDLRTTIRGFQLGLAGARAGGRRRLIIPPLLGYGARTSGQIPAGSVLVFQIDIAGVTTPTTATTTKLVR